MNDPTKASKKLVYHIQDNFTVRYQRTKEDLRKLRTQVSALSRSLDTINESLGILFGTVWQNPASHFETQAEGTKPTLPHIPKLNLGVQGK